MKEAALRKAHRIVGITISLFVILQVVTGLILSFELLEGPETGSGDVLEFLHFGGMYIGTVYRVALALGLLFLVASGWWIYLKITARTNAAKKQPSSFVQLKEETPESSRTMK
ncbi:MAG: hypothetical protein ACYC9O_09580 [Candidatus Latescibacterota bacterium]